MKSLYTSIAAIILALTSVTAAEYRQTVDVGALELLGAGVSASVIAPADPALGPKTDRNYADGYNRVDSSGDIGEGAPGLPSRTSNFGYNNNSQVDLQNGTLALHTISPGSGDYVHDSNVSSRGGAEVTYRILRDAPDAFVVGVEARAGYVDLDHSSRDAVATTVRILTDQYQLGGVVPQPAPYSGSFTVQPGTQRIGDTPTRTIATSAATAQGSRDFAAKGWIFRVGFMWQPVHTQTVNLQLDGGAALLDLKGTLNVNDTWVAPGQPSFSQSASGSRTKTLPGIYGGATIAVHLGTRWSAFAGVDYLSADTLSVHAATAAAHFTFSRAMLATAGLQYRF